MLDNEIDKLTYFDSFALKGEWWALGNARRKVTGTLKVDPSEHIVLELDNVLRKVTREVFAQSVFGTDNDRTIFGALDSGTPVTCFRCFRTRHDGSRSTHTVNFVVIGTHCKRLGALRCESMYLSTGELTSWVGKNAFISNFPSAGRRFEISVDHPENVVISIPMEKAILEVVSVGGTHFKDEEACLTQRYELLLTRASGISWKRFGHFNGALQNLLMLLSGDSGKLRRLGGISKSGDEPQMLRMFGVQSAHDHHPQHAGEMFFPLSTIQDRFEDVCQKWFASIKRNKGIYDVFFANLRGKRQYLETRFFNLAQCLEAFHRKWIARGGGKFLPPKKFKAVRKRIEASLPKRLPKDMHGAVRRVLSHANEFSFLERLDSLFNLMEPETIKMIADDPLRFRQAIRDTRNFFTHLERRKDSKAYRKSQWMDACRKMEMILFIHFLKLCGFTEAEIRPRLQHSRRFNTDPFVFDNGPEEESDI